MAPVSCSLAGNTAGCSEREALVSEQEIKLYEVITCHIKSAPDQNTRYTTGFYVGNLFIT